MPPLHENSRECSEDFDYDAVERDLDGVDDLQPDQKETDALEFGRRIVSFIRARPRARMTVDCLFLALGDAELEGVTMAAVAAENGVTKAAISKRVREIQDDLNLRQSHHNQSAHARHTYALSNGSPITLDPAKCRPVKARSRNQR